MVRQRKFKAGDKVRLNQYAIKQAEFSADQDDIRVLFEAGSIGEVIMPENMLPENSNFRYSVKFGDKLLILNEIQIDHLQK